MFLFHFSEKIANASADRPGFLGATTGYHRAPEVAGIFGCERFLYVDEGPYEAEVPVLGIGYGREGTERTSKHRVAEEGFAEIVGGVAKGDYVDIQALTNLVNGAAAEAGAEVAAMIGLLVQ